MKGKAMYRTYKIFSAGLVLLAGVGAHAGATKAPSGPAAFPVALKTEMLAEPMGLHAERPRFSWIMEDTATGARQTAYRIQAASSPEQFDRPDLWDSGKVDSDQSHLVPYGGEPLPSRRRVHWRVRSWDRDGNPSAWSKPSVFEMGLLDPSDWTARWIEPERYAFSESDLTRTWLEHAVLDTPGIGSPQREELHAASLEILRQARPLAVARKTFRIDGAPGDARLYLSALGFANVHINGQAVFDEWNTPAPTHYKIAARYKVFDVSGFLRHGENTVAVELSSGKYDERPGNHVGSFGDRPALRLQIEYRDGGRRLEVGTDDTWKMAVDPQNPVADFWAGSAKDGSEPDAVLAGFDDSNWPAAVLNPEHESKRLLPMLIPPERTVETVRPVKQWEIADGVWVFDFGRTVVGRVQLDLPAAEGRTYVIRYADSLKNVHSPSYDSILIRPPYPGRAVPGDAVGLGLKRRGNILFRNVKGRSYFTAVPTDVFRSPAAGAARFSPRFGIVPFRYMEVIGFDREPESGTVSANIAHTALERTGAFRCSDENLNRIHDAAIRTLLYNAHAFYYDNNGAEKGFWPHTFAMNLPPLTFNCNTAAYAAYILEEVDLFAREEGFTMTAISGRRGENSVAKLGFLIDSDYHVKLTHLHYLYHGDRKPLENHVDLIDRYIHDWGFMDQSRTPFRFDHFADHTAGSANLDVPESAFLNPLLRGKGNDNHNNIANELLCTIYGSHLLDLAAKISDLTGNPEVAAARRAKRDEIREAIREKYYWNPDYGYAVGSRSAQGANAAMVFYQAAPESEYPDLVRAIREDIRRWNNHLSTGSRLTYALLSVLSSNEYVDQAVEMLTTRRYPSLLSMLDYADTLSESWPLPDAPATTSHCQTEGYTAISKWFWTDLMGIRPDVQTPGFRHFFLKPKFPSRLESAAAEFESPYGTVSGEWQRLGDAIVWKVTVPWNAAATVLLPEYDAGRIRLDGKPVDKHEFRLSPGTWEIRIGN
jgi:alpha-L-rhamnosidase